MTLRSNSFVSAPEYLAKIKNTELRQLMMIGSCIRTPLEKKATFSWTWGNTSKGDMVTQVCFYSPNSHIPDKVFNLNEQTFIPLNDWYSIMTSVVEYHIFEEEVLERDRIRSIVKRFEEAALHHGARKATVANGFISDTEAYLRESGKILKEAREALYDEFDV